MKLFLVLIIVLDNEQGGVTPAMIKGQLLIVFDPTSQPLAHHKLLSIGFTMRRRQPPSHGKTTQVV